MNFNLTKLPPRTKQKRTFGITMINDKGLGMAEAENMLSVASTHIDMVKLAFGTAMVSSHVKEKIKLYQSHNIDVFFGGLLFEAFVIRNQFEDYIKMVDEHEISLIEISDGDIDIPHQKKCEFIKTLSARGRVISEIGSKDNDKVKITPPYRWIELMQAELNAGSSYLVAEAKESGHEGLYRDSGEVRQGLVAEILTKVPAEKIIWEAPEKDQQLYFIKLLGCNANLGNIEPNDAIPLETMRLGLRSDSFDFFLNGNG